MPSWAARKKRILMVGHTFIFNAGIQKVRQLLEQGTCGTIYYLKARRTNLGPVREDVNVVWDLAPHDIGILNWMPTARVVRAGP